MSGKTHFVFQQQTGGLAEFLGRERENRGMSHIRVGDVSVSRRPIRRSMYGEKKYSDYQSKVVSACQETRYARSEITLEPGYKTKAGTTGSCDCNLAFETASPTAKPIAMRNAKHHTKEASATHKPNPLSRGSLDARSTTSRLLRARGFGRAIVAVRLEMRQNT